MSSPDQWIRKVSLLLLDVTQTGGLDLSTLRIKFNILNGDYETPNTAVIRVYNLADATVDKITLSKNGEFNQVVLNAGYEESSNYGVIFSGTVKQYRKGRESNKDTYLDIFAADADIGYNQGVVNSAFASGSTPQQVLDTLAATMNNSGLDTSAFASGSFTNPNIRGVVLVGMARAALRNFVSKFNASWSIQRGTIVVKPLINYIQAGEVPEINVSTGLIGQPEQTDQGLRVTCLLNSRIQIGAVIKINNKDVQTTFQESQNTGNLAYNTLSQPTFYVPLSADGLYCVYVAEYEGDSRGQAWYSHLTCLAVNPINDTIVSPT